MTPATLYFDVVSPYAYIMDVLLRRASLPLEITLKPVLFAGLLKAHDNKGPAEIPRKRQYTYELCTWLAQRHDIPFRMPPVHPFNPIRYLRLIIALGSSRVVASAVFDSLYREGADPDDPRIWRALTVALGVAEPDAGSRRQRSSWRCVTTPRRRWRQGSLAYRRCLPVIGFSGGLIPCPCWRPGCPAIPRWNHRPCRLPARSAPASAGCEECWETGRKEAQGRCLPHLEACWCAELRVGMPCLRILAIC